MPKTTDKILDQYDPEYGRSEDLSIRVRAPIALITNPSVSRVCRTTYPFATHGCLRGLMRAIYPHTSVDYGIRRLHLMKPIQYDSFTSNEVASFGRMPFNTGDKDRRSQRRNTVLFDVDWVIDFYIKMVLPPRNAGDNLAKLVKQFLVHLRDGHRDQNPYVGLRENLADCELYDSPSRSRRLDTVATDVDPGLMYFDHPVINMGGDRRQPVNKSYYANVKMVGGVVEYPEWRSVVQQGMVIG